MTFEQLRDDLGFTFRNDVKILKHNLYNMQKCIDLKLLLWDEEEQEYLTGMTVAPFTSTNIRTWIKVDDDIVPYILNNYIKNFDIRISVKNQEIILTFINNTNTCQHLTANDFVANIGFFKKELIKYEDNIVNIQFNGVELPFYATEGASGMDIKANITEPISLKPLERKLIPTGIKIALPKGYEAQLRPRSGLSIKHGITLINCVGTIDEDYRGEICVPLVNLSNEEYIIQPQERIAQMVICSYKKIKWNKVDSLDETERGEGGFGSSGKF